MYICPQIYSEQNKEEILMTISFCFCSYSYECSWYLQLPSITQSVFPLPSASNSDGHGSLPSIRPRSKGLSLPGTSSRPRVVSQKEGSYLRVMAGTCSKILKACASIHLHGFGKGSKWYPFLSLTPQAWLDLLDHMTQGAEQLSQQQDLLQSLFFF